MQRLTRTEKAPERFEFLLGGSPFTCLFALVTWKAKSHIERVLFQHTDRDYDEHFPFQN